MNLQIHFHLPQGINLEQLMTLFDDLVDKVRRNKTHAGSVRTLMHGLATRITDLASGAEVPESVRTQLQSIAADLDSEDSDLSAAILEGTPLQPSGAGGTGTGGGSGTGSGTPPSPTPSPAP